MNTQTKGYLTKAAKIKSVITALVFMLAGAWWFLAGLVVLFQDVAREDGLYIALILIMCLGIAALTVGVLRLRELRTAVKCNEAFASCRTAFLSAGELARALHCSEDQVQAKMIRLFTKRYFSGCRMQSVPAGVILEDKISPEDRHEMENGPGIGFHEKVTVICPRCGGTTELAPGKNGRCQYCGTVIKSM